MSSRHLYLILYDRSLALSDSCVTPLLLIYFCMQHIPEYLTSSMLLTRADKRAKIIMQAPELFHTM